MSHGFQHLSCNVVAPHIALIQLARPEERNALSLPILQELVVALDFVRDTPEVRVVVLTGKGPVFSAGDEFRGTVPDLAQAGAPVAPMAIVLDKMSQLARPTIAAVNGLAHGAGLALALACDYVICGESAELCAPEIRFGLWAMHLAPYLVAAVGARKTFELMATGTPVRAKAAELMGLCNRAVPDAELQRETLTFATRLATLSPSALGLGARAIRSLAAAHRAELQAELDRLLATEDAAEGIAAFNAQRPPQWKGA